MGRKLFFFVLGNILFALLGITWFGYNSIYVMIQFFSLMIFVYGYKKYGLNLTVALIITYQLLFDGDFYSMTSLNLRTWYFLLLFIYFYNIIISLKNRIILKNKVNIYTLVINGSILCLGLISLAYLIIDPFSTKIHIIKYWLFYIGLVFFLIKSYKEALSRNVLHFIDYLISLGAIVGIWGIIQSVFNYSVGIRNIYNNPLPNFEFRPNAFFSETTWFSEYLLFMLIFVLFRIQLSKNYKLFPLLFIPIIGFLLSQTRNTYFALGVLLVFSLFLLIMKARFSMRLFKSIWFYAITLTVVLAIFFFHKVIAEQIAFMIYRFTSDGTGTGRIEGYEKGINLILEKPLFGHGFYWDNSFTTSEGNAYGAKAFNLFMMVAHITGLFGLFIFLLMLIFYYIKGFSVFLFDKSKSIYASKALIILTMFLSISFFAPLHQYPFGMQMVAISSALLFSYKPLIVNE